MRPLEQAPHSILICNIRLIGDVVLTTPLIKLLKEQYPQACIDFLANRGTGEFLEKDPRINKVHYSDKWRAGGRGLSVGYLAKILGRYDWAICLNPSDRGTVATVLAGRSCRVGFYEENKPLGAFWRKLLLSRPLAYDEEQHVVLSCGRIAEALGVPVHRLTVQIFWDDADAAAVLTLLRGDARSGQGYAVVHPFARWQYKYWDIARFAEVNDYIGSRYGLLPVWTSSPDAEEKRLLVEAAALCAIPPLVIPGQLSLNQMACLLHGAKLYVGLDTAITHIAASTGVPTVALYGPTEIWRWHPWDNAAKPGVSLTSGYRGDFHSGNVSALQAGCSHSPCIRPQCYHGGVENPCMMDLSVERVEREIDRFMRDAASNVSYANKDSLHAG